MFSLISSHICTSSWAYLDLISVSSSASSLATSLASFSSSSTDLQPHLQLHLWPHLTTSCTPSSSSSSSAAAPLLLATCSLFFLGQSDGSQLLALELKLELDLKLDQLHCSGGFYVSQTAYDKWMLFWAARKKPVTTKKRPKTEPSRARATWPTNWLLALAWTLGLVLVSNISNLVCVWLVYWHFYPVSRSIDFLPWQMLNYCFYYYCSAPSLGLRSFLFVKWLVAVSLLVFFCFFMDTFTDVWNNNNHNSSNSGNNNKY